MPLLGHPDISAPRYPHMKPLLSEPNAIELARIRAQVAGLRREIELAKQKRAGIEKAITSRENSLARLEAQLAIASPARQSTPMFAR